LRIEDTDQSRYVPGAVEDILDSLRWAGLEYDEGPDKEKGNGPYFQSQRLSLYREVVDQLLERGAAYRCFCSPERLAELRKSQEAAGQQTRYDRTCRWLTSEESERRAANEPYVIRLKIPDEPKILEFDDLIRGRVRYPLNQQDDQILLKSDGFPTYHLANVVDDHYMGVDTVIRGEEWLPSTPKHILLYQYLDWPIPRFAHLPLLLNPDRSKLSKRHGDVAVDDYRKGGYLPEALVNFVALLGWNPGDDREFFTLEELIQNFSLERVNKAGAVFDLDKLRWMNGKYIRELSEEEYLRRARAFLGEGGNKYSDAALLALRKEISTWADLRDQLHLFDPGTVEIQDETLVEWMTQDSSRQVLERLVELVKQSSGSPPAEQYFQWLKQIQKETGIRGKALFFPVRLALTGQPHGAELPLVAAGLGPQLVLERLTSALAKYHPR